MTLDRIFLFATSAVFLLFGLWGLFLPAEMLKRFGIALTDPAGKTAIRAMYGGFLIGAALLFGYAGLSQSTARFGLQAVLILSSAILAARIFGMVVDGQSSAFHLSYGLFEIVGIALSLWLLMRTGGR